MDISDISPCPTDIKLQLRRMLESPRFKNARNPSDFLAIAVRRALDGEGTSGRIITEAMFKDKQHKFDPSDTRVTASNLRRTLSKYYENEGSADLIYILLPMPPEDKTIKPSESDAYTPVFSFNPKLDYVVRIRRGYHCLERTTYLDLFNAYKAFESVLENRPEDVAAGLGMAETLCKFGENGWSNPCPYETVPTCNKLLETMRSAAEGNWRFWVALAHVQWVFGDKAQAPATYARALRIDRIRVERHVPYITFLIETKQGERALSLANRYYSESIEDAAVHAQFAIFCCMAGLIKEAAQVFESLLILEPNNCAAHEHLAIISFVKSDLQGARSHLQKLKLLCDETSYRLILCFFEEMEEEMAHKGWAASV